jgi:hypothetical protein
MGARVRVGWSGGEGGVGWGWVWGWVCGWGGVSHVGGSGKEGESHGAAPTSASGKGCCSGMVSSK